MEDLTDEREMLMEPEFQSPDEESDTGAAARLPVTYRWNARDKLFWERIIHITVSKSS